MNGGDGWPAETIRRMTLPEIALALDNDFSTRRTPPGGVSFASPEERQRYAEWFRGLTAKERLRLARDGHV